VNASTATVVQNGNSLTVNFPVTFTPAFSGTKNIYLLGLSGSGPSSGYQLMGTWMVP
jgi:hypothetical protein